jgi:hypothetical protein
MTGKQRRFALAIASGRTGKAAAIEAGYSPKSAESQASQLLKLPKVAAAVAEVEARGLERAELTASQLARDLYDAHLEARAAKQFGPAVTALGKLLDDITTGGHRMTGAVLLSAEERDVRIRELLERWSARTPSRVEATEVYAKA